MKSILKKPSKAEQEKPRDSEVKGTRHPSSAYDLDINEHYEKCASKTISKIDLFLENILPRGLRFGVRNFRDTQENVEKIMRAIEEKIQERLQSDQKVETPYEMYEFKSSLESFDDLVKEKLNFKLKQLETLLNVHYEKKFLRGSDSGETAIDGIGDNSMSERSVDEIDLENSDDVKVFNQWKKEVEKLKSRTSQSTNGLNESEVSKYSNKSNLSQSHAKGVIPWKPRKIIIGPETKSRPCIIPIPDTNDPQNELIEKLLQSSRNFKPMKTSANDPVVPSNTKKFFLHQIKRKSYFKNLYYLTEHHKQTDLLLRGLGQAIEGYLRKANTEELSRNKCLEEIKSKLNEQLMNIKEDFNGLYEILGVEDIAAVKNFLPKPEELFCETKYGFVEEVRLKKLVEKYETENKITKEKYQLMNNTKC